MDKEIVIKGCENWVNNHKGENFLLTYSSVVELLAVLKEQEAEIAFLKAMQLQTVHNMSNEDIGNAVRNVLRL